MHSYCFKGSVRENKRGYRLNAIKKALLIATNLASICCVYKEKIIKKTTLTEEHSTKFLKLQYSTQIVNKSTYFQIS